MAAGTTWRNWARNQQCAPEVVEHPSSDAELASLVKTAGSAGHTVKVIGAGHSFTDIACTSGYQLQLDRYGRVLSHDRESGRVTVQSGITLGALNRVLDDRGLALPNLGDIAYQTVAGAISTATHGTGVKLGGLATQVVGLDLVTADGSIVTCSESEEPDVFSAARVGLGALGVLGSVTLQAVPAFNLHVVEQPMRVDDLLEHIDDHVEGNDHFEFFYIPHTGWALTKRNNRTDRPLAPRKRWQEIRDDVLVQNVGFGAVCRVGRVFPALIPRLAKALPSSGRVEYVDKSWRVFASPRFVHFYEMEYAIPRAAAVEALQQIRSWIDSSGLRISFPIEVRFTAPDDIWLSTASGRETCYIAVHVYWGMPYEQYFRGVEAIMDSFGGRPHWGKMHYQNAVSLAPRYEHWARFQKVRRRLDPEGRFVNAYTDRVLGPAL
jgi:FAD-linked oxidoreductase